MTPGDFRQIQILTRQQSAKDLFYHYQGLRDLEGYIQKYPRQKRFIFSQVWIDDLLIFSDRTFLRRLTDDMCFALVAPHILKESSIKQWQDELKNLGFIVETIDLKKEVSWRPGVIYLATNKGILCELYSLFGSAYVGGGFTRSVHSLLEPYLAGNLVFCGEKIHRSTEFDSIRSHDKAWACSTGRPR